MPSFSRLAGLLLILTSALNLIWPKLHSVALRNSLLAVLLLTGLWLYRRLARGGLPLRQLRLPVWLYLLLSGWLLATVTLADDPLNSLTQYRGEWLMGAVALAIGLLLATLARSGRLTGLTPQALIIAITLGLALPVLGLIGLNLLDVFAGQPLALGEAPGYGRTSLSYSHNILFGFLLADAVARCSGKPRLLPLPAAALLAALALSLFATYLLNTRNGTLCVLLMILLAVGLIVWQQRQRIRPAWLLGALLLAGALTAFIRLAYQADQRWATFRESTQLALDTQTHRAWLYPDMPRPLMRNGQPVDESAYMRLAWFKEGALAILDYPLGVGFGRNAYGHAMQRKYGIKGGHSHSSLIDFTLSGGIPGILLWLALSAALIRLGWQAFIQRSDSAGIVLSLFVAGTLLRMLIDSNLRDHGLEQTLFLYALLATLALPARPTPPSPT